MTTLYLIRHGETVANTSGIVAGMYDAKLTEAGKQQGKLVTEHFKDIPLDAIYASDLSRAVFMAKDIARYHNLPVLCETRLREINLGDWEGCHVSEMQKKWPELYRVWMEDQGRCKCPNGECAEDVLKRVLEGLNAIVEQHPRQTVLCVMHGLVLKVLYMHLINASLSDFRDLKYVTNASITVLEADAKNLRLVTYGDDSYLSCDMVTHIFSEA